MTDILVAIVVIIVLWAVAVGTNLAAVAYERRLTRPQRATLIFNIVVLTCCVVAFAVIAVTGPVVDILWVLPFIVMAFGIIRLAEANRWVRFQRQLRGWKEDQDQFESQFPILADRLEKRGSLLGPIGPIYKSEIADLDDAAEDDNQFAAPQHVTTDASPGGTDSSTENSGHHDDEHPGDEDIGVASVRRK